MAVAVLCGCAKGDAPRSASAQTSAAATVAPIDCELATFAASGQSVSTREVRILEAYLHPPPPRTQLVEFVVTAAALEFRETGTVTEDSPHARIEGYARRTKGLGLDVADPATLRSAGEELDAKIGPVLRRDEACRLRFVHGHES